MIEKRDVIILIPVVGIYYILFNVFDLHGLVSAILACLSIPATTYLLHIHKAIPNTNEAVSSNIASPVDAVSEAPSYTYASFWGRLGAWIADQIITTPIYYLLMILIATAYPELTQSEVEVATFTIAIGAFWIYFASFNSSAWQATPGKKLFGYKVADLQGNPIDFGIATKQHFATILSTLTFLLVS